MTGRWSAVHLLRTVTYDGVGWRRSVCLESGSTAAITGTVMDASGAPIAGRDSYGHRSRSTAQSASAETNDSGAIRHRSPPVGTTRLKVAKAGFRRVHPPPICAYVNQTARIDIQMKVGKVTESIEVTGRRASDGDRVTWSTPSSMSRTNENLPLASRNYVQLTLLSPGSVSTDPSSFNNGNNTGGMVAVR